jgi:hypothetical protein
LYDDDDDDDDDDDRVGYDSKRRSMAIGGDVKVPRGAAATERDDGTSELHFPGDIECHLGSDQRYYVIDVARLFPPEAPSLFLFGILLDPEANSMTEIELSVRERRRSIVTADVHQRLVVLLGDGYETVAGRRRHAAAPRRHRHGELARHGADQPCTDSRAANDVRRHCAAWRWRCAPSARRI